MGVVIMEPNYKYENKMVIDKRINEVALALIDYENYHKWQSTLKRVELLKGSFLEEDHLVHLVFEAGQNNEMVMSETLLELQLPHKVINRYQVGSTVNIQKNYFEALDNKTSWTCVTEFYFEANPPAGLDIFKKSTEQSLLLFKQYVESK